MSDHSYWTRLSQQRLSRRGALRSTAVGAAGLAGAALIGCGDDDDDDDDGGVGTPVATATATATGPGATATPTVAAEEINREGELRIVRSEDRGSLDPQAVAGVANYFSAGFFYGAVLVQDPVTRAPVPHMGSFEWADANETVIIRVHPGIIDHEGFPYLAEDLAWSMQRSAEKGEFADRDDFTSARAQLWTDLGEPEVVDDLTIRMKVLSPNVTLPATTFGTAMVTRRYFERVGGDQAGLEPSGFGSFRFVSRIPDTETKATRYDDYFWDNTNAYGPWKTTFKDMTLLVRPEPISQVAALKAGEADFVPEMEVELATSEFGDDDDFEVVFVNRGLGHAIQMNTQVATVPDTGEVNPFLDERVRAAANLAIDRQGYIDSLLTGKEGLLRGLSSISGGFPAGEIEQFDPGFDLEKAKALMVEAGYAEGFDVPLYHGTGYFSQSDEIVQIVQQSLEKIGIRAEILTMPFADELPIIRDKTVWGLFYFGSSGTADVEGNALAFWGDEGFYNQSAIPGSKLDDLTQAQKSAFDSEERAEILKEAWILHYTQQGWIFLHEEIQTAVYSSKRLRWEPDGGEDRLKFAPSEYEFHVLNT